MSLFNIMAVSGSSLEAQGLRLNTIASNLANANSVAGSEREAYRARLPVFETVYRDAAGERGASAGVRVRGVVESALPPRQEYDPGHPLANEEGYVFRPNIDAVDEMANMIAASRAYQNSVQTMATAKQLMLQTINLGK
jgi:flagellar basal-body rod protein FlgC